MIPFDKNDASLVDNIERHFIAFLKRVFKFIYEKSVPVMV